MNYYTKKRDLLYIDSLSNLYYDEGASVLFANLFDDLAEGFPTNKIQRLQDLIRCKIEMLFCNFVHNTWLIQGILLMGFFFF